MVFERDTTFTSYGHSCVEVRTPGGKVILIDPWFGNPRSPRTADSVEACDLLLVTHGHFDHMGDAVALASRLRPAWPCMHEMSLWLARRLPGGADAAIGMNKGGTFEVDWHPRDDDPRGSLGGRLEPGRRDDALPRRAGRLRGRAGERLHVLLRRRHRRVRRHALHRGAASAGRRVPADRRSLHDGPATRPRSPAELLGVGHVVPIHYGTFPILAGTPDQLREELAARGLSNVQVHALEPGQSLS